ncbi:MAG: hypothetical protein AB7P03_19090 [Kofleriaceae bacterium]
MKTLLTSLLVGTVIAAIGCGGGGTGSLTASESCETNIETLCELAYECYSAEELEQEQFPPTKAECIEELKSFAMCGAVTAENFCEDGETYHADKAGECADALNDLTCSEFKDDIVPEPCNLACE